MGHDTSYSILLWWRLIHKTATLPQVEILMPRKKPSGADLPRAQQRANQALHSRQLRIEHVNSSVKLLSLVVQRPLSACGSKRAKGPGDV